LRAGANVEFSQSELEAISRQLEQAERRFDVGLVPVTDVRSAQAQYDLAVAQEIAASNQLSTAQEALVLVSGLNPDTLSPLAEDLPLLPPAPANIDSWVDTAMDQNLELVIARLENDNTQTQVEIERASRYPTLDLVGTAASSTTDLTGRSDADVAEIKLQLTLPILTGGLINSRIAQARASALSSDDKLIAQERATIQQTRDGYRGVQASISLVKALRQALDSTQKSAEATEAGFRAGTRTSVEVLQALRDTFSARSEYASARYDYIINSLNLKAAAGNLSENDIYSINRFLTNPE
jgi:outer membrane protein